MVDPKIAEIHIFYTYNRLSDGWTDEELVKDIIEFCPEFKSAEEVKLFAEHLNENQINLISVGRYRCYMEFYRKYTEQGLIDLIKEWRKNQY